MMRQGWISGLALIAFATSASAQERPANFVPPSWTRVPDPDLASSLHPTFAGLIGITGWASIKCLAVEDGHMFDCRVEDESHPGLGFGSAGRLVVAGGRVRAARIDGQATARWVTTRANFISPDLDETPPLWRGPEPTEQALALAREVVAIDNYYPHLTVEEILRSVDFDRRETIRAWINELLPDYDSILRDAPAIQLARVMSIADLQTIVDGGIVSRPDPELWLAACPEPDENELTALRELRRRYCERWSCEAQPI